MAKQIPTQVTSRGVRPVPGAAAGLTPGEMIGMLRQHIFLIIIFIVAGFVIGVTSWFFLKKYAPEYTATTYIEVLSAAEMDPLRITPYTVGQDIQYSYRRTLASQLTQQGFFQSVLNRDRIRETNWFQSLGEGGAGEGPSIEKSIRRGLQFLKANFRVTPERDSDLITVTMTCGDREESALIANEIVDLFVRERGVGEAADIREKIRILREQQTNVRNELSTIQNNLNAIRLKSGYTDLESHNYMDVITQRVADLELENNDLILSITNTKTAILTLERQASGPIAEQVSRVVENDPIMISLLQARMALEAEMASRLARFGENHRVTRQIQERINEINEKRNERKIEIGELIRQSNLKNVQDQLQILQSSLEELQRQKEEAEAAKEQLDLARVQYEDLMISREEKQEELEEIGGAISTYTVKLNDPETPKVKRLGSAPVPLDVSFPRWEIFFPVSTFLGFLLGIGIAFLKERLNDLVRTPRDVGRYLHIPLLGMVPDADEDEQLEGIDPVMAVSKAPYSVVTEAYRRFRSHLISSAPNAKIFLVSSGMAGDGKTSVTVNLATTLAGQNNKILLIDSNFWRPNINTIFPPPSEPILSPEDESNNEESEENSGYELGLSTVLSGLCGYHEVIRPSNIENLDVISAGILPPNPAELLGGAAMEQFIKYQREKYDYVVIDGPPVLLVSDIKLLAGLVDGMILVFNATKTARGAALRTIAELRQVKATILGCVLFAVQPMKGGYFREQFKAYREYQKLQMANTAAH